jgi:hypothetical protein
MRGPPRRKLFNFCSQLEQIRVNVPMVRVSEVDFS